LGLIDAMRHEVARSKAPLAFASHPDAVYAGALGAALWGRYRYDKLAALEHAR
jgi:benzoyl-CoA reductase subunit D